TERPADPQGRAERDCVVRGLKLLDDREREHGAEVPALTQDEAGPGDPVLREQRGKREQDEVRRQERREAEDGGDRTRREGDQEGGQDREAREDEDAARDEGPPVRERESFLHGPRTRLTSDKGNAHLWRLQCSWKLRQLGPGFRCCSEREVSTRSRRGLS